MARLDYSKAAPGALKAMLGLQQYVNECGIEQPLMELVKMRASQINGCAYCLDMHSKDARAAGEAEQRLYALNAWSETPFFTPREQAALVWTEAVTQVSSTPDHVSDALYARVRKQFSEKEIVDLTLCVIAINGWNRLAIPFRTDVGAYQPPKER